MATDATDIVKIAHITNIRRQPVQIIVNDIEGTDGIILFDQSGIISLASRESIEVEQDRLNLGQIENLFKKQFLHVIFMDRDIDGDMT